jgi:predicted nicotinamide N-methyase
MGAAFVTVNDIDPQAIEAVKWNAKINQIPIEKLNFDNTNFLDGDIERNASELSKSFDILLMGDMFFDQKLGLDLSNLAKMFKANSSVTSKRNKRRRVLVGDPGRWLIGEQQQQQQQNNKVNQQPDDYCQIDTTTTNLNCLAKYDLPSDIKKDHFGLVSGFVYEIE